MAAAAILDHSADACHSLHEYELAVRREIYSEFNVAARLAQIIYTFPRLPHRLLFHYEDVIGLYYECPSRARDVPDLYGNAKGMIKVSVSRYLHRKPSPRSKHCGPIARG